ncbi:SUMO1 sentrin specific peptidase 8 [Coelomomyces lativittatus]|nr:SUMO1 sentrin specific peptidase 8 [Coelomomyces lativittatus]KAJ1513783.1 SUMO1 sentrin specific peptidase 8 [Coelomomyces lativittatus]KAJ1517828.1 SUMO1 sentrin specific peptidase 8 [Coelomomyces lativittatus]
MDQKVLNYGDSVLYQSNIDTLAINEYLDDSILSFVFEYFEKELFYPLSDVRLIPAAILKLMVDIEDPAYLESAFSTESFKERIFLAPVTDHRGNSPGQGTHWSLLMWNRESNSFHHYDSANHSNRSHAQYTARKLYKLFTGFTNPPTINFEPCISQKNATDCGIFVIAKTYQLLCEHTCIPLSHDPKDLSSFRTWIKELLQSKSVFEIKFGSDS